MTTELVYVYRSCRISKPPFFLCDAEVRISALRSKCFHLCPFSLQHLPDCIAASIVNGCYPFVTLFALQDHGGALKQLR